MAFFSQLKENIDFGTHELDVHSLLPLVLVPDPSGDPESEKSKPRLQDAVETRGGVCVCVFCY